MKAARVEVRALGETEEAGLGVTAATAETLLEGPGPPPFVGIDKTPPARAKPISLALPALFNCTSLRSPLL